MNFTKEQTEELLSKFAAEKNGLNTVLEMVLNWLMRCERTSFLETEEHNKANGYRLGKVFGHGAQLELSIPRDRLSDFRPMILALLRDQESHIKDICFELYTKGLTTRDTSDIIEKIYGNSYKRSTISNINKSFYQEMELWRERNLESHYLCVYIDGIFINVKRNNKYTKECFYIILGLKEDYSREILSIVNFPTESSSSWEIIFDELKQRGVETIGLIVSDSLSGISNSISKKFNSSAHQKCIVHLYRRLMNYVRPEDKTEVIEDFKEILNVDDPDHTIDDALKYFEKFKEKWSLNYSKFGKYLNKLEVHDYLTFLNYKPCIRRMIYTTNWIERFNKSVRKTVKIRGGFPTEESILALITSVAIDMTEGTYKYKIYNFKFEQKLFKQNLE